MATIDKASLKSAYDDVRDDNTETNWAFFGYDENAIKTAHTGKDFEELKALFQPGERAFAFLRVFSGDELSKRAKFTLITWCGASVSPLKRARISADKALVKEVIQSYAVDVLFNDEKDVTEEHIMDSIRRAGGAHYGTG